MLVRIGDVMPKGKSEGQKMGVSWLRLSDPPEASTFFHGTLHTLHFLGYNPPFCPPLPLKTPSNSIEIPLRHPSTSDTSKKTGGLKSEILTENCFHNRGVSDFTSVPLVRKNLLFPFASSTVYPLG